MNLLKNSFFNIVFKLITKKKINNYELFVGPKHIR